MTLDDKLAQALKKLAHDSGKTFKEVVNQTLRAGLSAESAPPKPKPYRVKPAKLGGVQPGINLDKALQISDAIEDEEIVRKLELRK